MSRTDSRGDFSLGDPRDDYMSSSEEELVPGEAQKFGRRKAFIAAAGLLCLAGACTFAAKAVSAMPQQHLRKQPMTARALLESPGLADLATENLMAVGGPEWSGSVNRHEVRAAVGARLMNISGTIQKRDPEAHRQLEALELSPEQQAKVYRTLSHFGDKRVRDLSSVLATAVQQTAQENGDAAALKRRLTEKLAPRTAEIQQMTKDMFPDKAQTFNFKMDLDHNQVTSNYHKWHLQMGVSQPVTGRRLTAFEQDDVSKSVDIQARSMFSRLSDEFGSAMPKAPARMLYSSTDQYGGDQYAQQPQQSGQESFMDCMMKQMTSMNIPGCLGCVMSNMEAVFEMVSGFLMPSSTT